MNSDSEEEVVFKRKKKYIVESDEDDLPQSFSSTAADSTLEYSCTDLNLNKTSKENDSVQNHEKLSDENPDTNNTSRSQINPGLVEGCKSNQYCTPKENSGNLKKAWYKNSDLFEDDSSGEDEDSKMINKYSGDDKSNSGDTEQDAPPLIAKNKSWYKNSDLFEEDSSGDEKNKKDEENNTTDGEQSDMDNTSVPAPSSSVRPTEKKERKSKTKAQNEIQEIRRESQRKMREAPTSLPYHRPRMRTLAEFLNRKKAPHTIPLLHNSEDVLRSAWNAIEEREKEAETFYKSESSDEESEHEEDKSVNNDQKTETNDMANYDLDKRSINCNKDKVLTAEKATNEDNENKTEGEDEKNGRHFILPLSSVVSLENPALNTIDENNENQYSKIELISHSNESDQHSGSEEAVLDNNGVVNVNPIELKSHITESKQEAVLTKFNTILVKSNNLNLDSDISNTSKDSIINATFGEQSKVTENKLINHNITSNLVNTEEFSLRYSESQRGLDLIPNVIRTDMDISNKSEELELNIPLDKVINENNENKLIKEALSDHFFNGKDKEMLESDLNKNGETLAKNTLCEVESIEEKLMKKYNIDLKQPIPDFAKLSGTHGTMIDLDEKINKPGVNGLMDRFMKHLSYKNKPVKKKKPVEISIISTETDSSGKVNGIQEETLCVLVGDEEDGEKDPSLARPGAKMARLKAQLELEMGRKRELEWTRKQQEQRMYEQEIYEEEEATDEEDAIANPDKEGYENDAQCSEGDDEESEEEDDEDIEEEDSENRPPKKKNAFVDDEAEESDDGCEENDEEDCSDSFIKKSKPKEILKRQSTEDIFLSQGLLKYSALDPIDEDEMTSFQKPLPRGEKEEDTDDVTSQSSVCQSPAFPLTALQGKDMNSFNWSEPTTPCKDLLSPKTVTPVRARIAHMVDKSPLIGSQDLENLCSGQFVSQIGHEMTPTADEDNSQEDFTLFLDDSEQTETPKKASSLAKTGKSNLDEKSTLGLFLEDGMHGDADGDEISNKINNKKVKRLNFSDDEEEDEGNTNVAPEESETEEKVEDSEIEENEEVGEVEYDSEENEVVRTAGEFLEKEAELSEEEWESEDEDERGLDTLEMEEADRENIDQRRVQRELGKLHMKQTLADDKMKVRLLQERFLEDGELHTESKRQRLFRWSNNVSKSARLPNPVHIPKAFNEDDNKAQIDSDGEKEDDDGEDEEHWRRSRHEREQYLNEHKKNLEKMDLEIEESDSQLLKLGHQALKRLNSKDQDKDQGPTPVANIASPNPKKPYKLTVTRGSFLSRGDQVLSRLARITTASEGPINQPKNSRNFVFTSISPTKDSDADVQPLQKSNKRKIPPMVMPIPKRTCAQQPKTANRKSLFEALAKLKS